jgi:DNA phosphorothioation-associated putative methyltransferase
MSDTVNAFRLASTKPDQAQAMVVSVRVDRTLDDAEEFGDGVLTDRGTFQKLYAQDEFKSFVEEVLGQRMHTASLGIGYVFKSPDAEQRYLASRAFTRRLEYRTDLIADFAKDKAARAYVKLANQLGRVPLPEEFPGFQDLADRFGSEQRVERLLLAKIDREDYEGSRAERRNDILVYLAMLKLQGIAPPPFRALPTPVQGDVKATWGSWERALRDGAEFLFSLGVPGAIKTVCAASPVGKLLPGDLYVHRSAEDELPALARVVLFAAKRIVGDMTYDLAKISLDGKAVAFLAYPGFDDVAHPYLKRSVRVYLPKAAWEVRDYHATSNPPILHRKDALVAESYPKFKMFRALTEEEERLGLLSHHDIGFRTGWDALLASRRLVIDGHTIRQAP